MTKKEYSYAEHRFRFAAWAAARAVKKLSAEKSKEKLTTILTDILRETFFDKRTGEGNWQLKDEVLEDSWLLKISDFDTRHQEWRDCIRQRAEEKGITHTDIAGEAMSHGQAAKLINVFIKALMPSDMDKVSDERKKLWGKVHPPIDSILLRKMDKCGFGNGNVKWVKQYGPWTQLTPYKYEKLINDIRLYEPCLWKTERFWKL